MKNRIILTLFLCFVLLHSMTSCSSMPEKAQPVKQFDVNRYLGTWYEIARFDYYFEKDLDNAMAQYSLNADGSVDVVNSGYNLNKNKWVSVNGTAKFRGDKDAAALKVSFFGPFYAGYNVVALEDYKYALVAGKNLDYLWILSREKTIPENVKQDFIIKAKEIGYDTSKLIWVKQDKKSPFDK
ncbi:lipocalin family protein [Chryseobacterium sp. JK1]|uniref:lipocalin family protein n=1 Tax=Chryseobacterium sp. JK1 TaxID=874294 RepID=UPI003D699237